MSEKPASVEQLAAILCERDAEIASLREQLANAVADAKRWTEGRWMEHSTSPEKEKLPVPRLEIRWYQDSDDGETWVAMYNFVYRHLLGDAVCVPLGRTRSRRQPPTASGKVETPFRDGAHILADAASLRLPAYAVCGELATRIETDEDRRVAERQRR